VCVPLILAKKLAIFSQANFLLSSLHAHQYNIVRKIL
jgi:hypothetical protein